MGVLDKEHRGWGCLSVQLVVGGVALWAGISSQPSRWRYGQAGALLIGTVIVAVVALRVVANLAEAYAARPRAGSAVLVVALGLVVAGIAILNGHKSDRRAAERQTRLERYQSVRLGATVAEVEAILGPRTTYDFGASFIDERHRCTRSAGARERAATFVAWTGSEGRAHTFVGYDSTDRVAYTCFAETCAWRDAAGACQRWDP